MMTTAENIGYGQQEPWDLGGEFNVIAFIVRQMMARMSTMKLVRVEAVNTVAGTVDVHPLVNQIDGGGNATPHGIVHGLPYLRFQGGTAGIICPPAVGDVGFVVVSDRDISAVKASGGEQSNPGSLRKFNLADGVYIGGILNAAPTTFLEFKSDGGVKIGDSLGNLIETSLAGITVTPRAGGSFVVNGAIRATGAITAGFGTPGAVGLTTHLHTSGGSGSPTSTPTPGT